MIGKLSGIIDSFGTAYLILDVNGVGYVVHASTRTLSQVGQKGDAVALLIETHVREDAIQLYGFQSAAEQDWFRLLTSVQGVGAKAGLAILSVCPPEQLSLAIAAQDKAILTRADGVGPKLATRILTELKDKSVSLGGDVIKPVDFAAPSSAPEIIPGIDEDAVSALVNLGYARSDAFAAVARAKGKANDNDQDKLDTIIRLALKELSA